MNAPSSTRPDPDVRLRRRGKAATEVVVDGHRIAVLDEGRMSGEIRRAVREGVFRWQLDVSGP